MLQAMRYASGASGLALAIWLVPVAGGSWSPAAGDSKIFAQELLENSIKNHPEVAELEMSATPPGKNQCVTIAATVTKNVGEKCDKDELTAMKKNQPWVEKEKEGYDVTMPLHDASGKMVGAVGIDFKLKEGQQEAEVVKLAGEIVHEMEQQIPAKEKLFENGKS